MGTDFEDTKAEESLQQVCVLQTMMTTRVCGPVHPSMAEDNWSLDGRGQVDINTTMGSKIGTVTKGLCPSEIVNTDCRSGIDGQLTNSCLASVAKLCN